MLSLRRKLTLRRKTGQVAVRCRGLSSRERGKPQTSDILDVVDQKVVIVRDPDEGNKDYLDAKQNRTKEKQFTFDKAFGITCTNRDVYEGTVKDLVYKVIEGLNVTVFAYGATGSGKTYTMVGSPQDPGLMVQSLETIFDIAKESKAGDFEFKVMCSYLEVYNEVIYDLLVPNSGSLDLREDPELGVVVAGLKKIEVDTPEAIMALLNQGNGRRKTESTDANKTSSRSHAVLEIGVEKRQKNQYSSQVLRGKLCLVDLAGSERAKETQNTGKKLREGANINKSLLALANCINALGKVGLKQSSYVPYRNSKLTRLLKDGLSGNSRTAMIANVACCNEQYSHTINTLKYADRAKEIKTHVSANIATVDSHITEYKKMIDSLQQQVVLLKQKLLEAESALQQHSNSTCSEEAAVALDELVSCLHESVNQQLGLQNQLQAIESSIVEDQIELHALQSVRHDAKDSAQGIADARICELEGALEQKTKERDSLRLELDVLEKHANQLNSRYNQILPAEKSKSLSLLFSGYFEQCLEKGKLKYNLSKKDEIISDQTQMISNLWDIVLQSGVDSERLKNISGQITRQLHNAEAFSLKGGEESTRHAAGESNCTENTDEERVHRDPSCVPGLQSCMEGIEAMDCIEEEDKENFQTPQKKARASVRDRGGALRDGSNGSSMRRPNKIQTPQEKVPPSSTQKMKEEIKSIWQEIRALKPKANRIADENGTSNRITKATENSVRRSKRTRSNRMSF